MLDVCYSYTVLATFIGTPAEDDSKPFTAVEYNLILFEKSNFSFENLSSDVENCFKELIVLKESQLPHKFFKMYIATLF